MKRLRRLSGEEHGFALVIALAVTVALFTTGTVSLGQSARRKARSSPPV